MNPDGRGGVGSSPREIPFFLPSHAWDDEDALKTLACELGVAFSWPCESHERRVVLFAGGGCIFRVMALGGSTLRPHQAQDGEG